MGRPATLLEKLCVHALSLGAQSLEVEYKDHREWVFVHNGGVRIGVASYASTSADAEELRGNLYAAQKTVRTVFDGQVYLLKARVFENFGEDAFEVSLDPALKHDPLVQPLFTVKQGQYLAFIYNWTVLSSQYPSRCDLL